MSSTARASTSASAQATPASANILIPDFSETGWRMAMCIGQGVNFFVMFSRFGSEDNAQHKGFETALREAGFQDVGLPGVLVQALNDPHEVIEGLVQSTGITRQKIINAKAFLLESQVDAARIRQQHAISHAWSNATSLTSKKLSNLISEPWNNTQQSLFAQSPLNDKLDPLIREQQESLSAHQFAKQGFLLLGQNSDGERVYERIDGQRLINERLLESTSSSKLVLETSDATRSRFLRPDLDITLRLKALDVLDQDVDLVVRDESKVIYQLLEVDQAAQQLNDDGLIEALFNNIQPGQVISTSEFFFALRTAFGSDLADAFERGSTAAQVSVEILQKGLHERIDALANVQLETMRNAKEPVLARLAVAEQWEGIKPTFASDGPIPLGLHLSHTLNAIYQQGGINATAPSTLPPFTESREDLADLLAQMPLIQAQEMGIFISYNNETAQHTQSPQDEAALQQVADAFDHVAVYDLPHTLRPHPVVNALHPNAASCTHRIILVQGRKDSPIEGATLPAASRLFSYESLWEKASEFIQTHLPQLALDAPAPQLAEEASNEIVSISNDTQPPLATANPVPVAEAEAEVEDGVDAPLSPLPLAPNGNAQIDTQASSDLRLDNAEDGHAASEALVLDGTITQPPASTPSEITAGEESDFQKHYMPSSKGMNVGLMTPTLFVEAARIALDNLEAETGMDVDTMACEGLGWTTQEMHQRISAEQVDTIALIKNSMRKDRGFLLADGSGVGKGRTLATTALLHKNAGLTPLFITANRQLLRNLRREVEVIGELSSLGNVMTLSTTADLDDEKGHVYAKAQTKKHLIDIFSKKDVPDVDMLVMSITELQSDALPVDSYRRHCLAKELLDAQYDRQTCLEKIDAISGYKGKRILLQLSKSFRFSDHKHTGDTYFFPKLSILDYQNFSPLFTNASFLQGLDNDQSIDALNKKIQEIDDEIENAEEYDCIYTVEEFCEKLPIDVKHDIYIEDYSKDNASALDFILRADSATPEVIVHQGQPKNFDLIQAPDGLSKKATSKLIEQTRGGYSFPKNGDLVSQELLIEHLSAYKEQLTFQLTLRQMSDEGFNQYLRNMLVENVNSLRQNWLAQPEVAENLGLLLDESHKNSSITSKTHNNLSPLINNVKHIVYSSATYVGGNDFSIYHRLFPRDVKDSITKILKKGDEPLKEILAQMLVQDGVMVRRELPMSMSKIQQFNDPKLLAHNDHCVNAFADIMALALNISHDVSLLVEKENIDAIKKIEVTMKNADAETYKKIKKHFPKIDSPAVTYISVDSKLTVLGQLFSLSLNAENATSRAIQQLEQGYKPILVMDKTLEASMVREAKRLAAEHIQITGLEAEHDFEDDERGSDISLSQVFRILGKNTKRIHLGNEPLDFRVALNQFLDSITTYRTYDLSSNSIVYRKAKAPKIDSLIDQMSQLIEKFPLMPLSPIDYITEKLNEHGYTSIELSGRNVKISKVGSEFFIEKTKLQDRNDILDKFNKDHVDAIIMSGVGSTGIELHSDSRHIDNGHAKPRWMGMLQTFSNVKELMQMMSRVVRRNQEHQAVIEILDPGTPTNTRQMLLMLKNLASLKANITGMAASELSTTVSQVDFSNVVGNVAAAYWMMDNPRLSHLLFHDQERKDAETLVKLYSSSGFERIPQDSNHFITRLTMRLPALRADEQRKCLQGLTDLFNDILNETISTGYNPLSAVRFDIKAKIVEKKPFSLQESSSSFDQPCYITKVLPSNPLSITSSDFIEEKITSFDQFTNAAVPHVDQMEADLLVELQANSIPNIDALFAQLNVISSSSIVDSHLLDLGVCATRITESKKMMDSCPPGSVLIYPDGIKQPKIIILGYKPCPIDAVKVIFLRQNGHIGQSGVKFFSEQGLNERSSSSSFLFNSSELYCGQHYPSNEIFKQINRSRSAVMVASKPGDTHYDDTIAIFMANKQYLEPAYFLTGNSWSASKHSFQFNLGKINYFSDDNGVWHSGIRVTKELVEKRLRSNASPSMTVDLVKGHFPCVDSLLDTLDAKGDMTPDGFKNGYGYYFNDTQQKRYFGCGMLIFGYNNDPAFFSPSFYILKPTDGDYAQSNFLVINKRSNLKINDLPTFQVAVDFPETLQILNYFHYHLRIYNIDTSSPTLEKDINSLFIQNHEVLLHPDYLPFIEKAISLDWKDPNLLHLLNAPSLDLDQISAELDLADTSDVLLQQLLVEELDVEVDAANTTSFPDVLGDGFGNTDSSLASKPDPADPILPPAPGMRFR